MKRQGTIWQAFFMGLAFKLDYHRYRANGFTWLRGGKDGFIYETYFGLQRLHTGRPQEDGWSFILGPFVFTVAWINKKPSKKRDLVCRNPDLK